MPERLKILLSAYACEPDRGSEPEVGWGLATHLAQLHEVWILTRSANRPSIENRLKDHPLPSAHWVYFDLPSWARSWKQGERGFLLYYFFWQIGAYFRARALHGSIGFDVVHHVTFVTYWLPTFLWMLPAPFVWGPVGGGDFIPAGFRAALGWRGRLHEALRDLVLASDRIHPLLRLALKNSRATLATTTETGRRLRSLGAQHVETLTQVAMTEDEVARIAARPGNPGQGPIRFISVGRLIPWKGFHFAVSAFAHVQRILPDSSYHIVGEGPERRRLERLTKEAGLESHVSFLGWLSRRHVFGAIAECDILVYPSFHDSGCFVILEAMATGVPVVCLDVGGPSILVSQDTGIRIPVSSPNRLVSDLAGAMLRLSEDTPLRMSMGRAARDRVLSDFTWRDKACRISSIYESIVAEESSR